MFIFSSILKVWEKKWVWVEMKEFADQRAARESLGLRWYGAAGPLLPAPLILPNPFSLNFTSSPQTTLLQQLPRDFPYLLLQPPPHHPSTLCHPVAIVIGNTSIARSFPIASIYWYLTKNQTSVPNRRSSGFSYISIHCYFVNSVLPRRLTQETPSVRQCLRTWEHWRAIWHVADRETGGSRVGGTIGRYRPN